MGMPQVPERECLPDIEQVVVMILESVALEELAMSHILNAEGEKLQAVVAEFSSDNLCCKCLKEAFKQTTTTVNSLIMKEWIMINKINSTLDIFDKIDDRSKEC